MIVCAGLLIAWIALASISLSRLVTFESGHLFFYLLGTSLGGCTCVLCKLVSLSLSRLVTFESGHLFVYLLGTSRVIVLCTLVWLCQYVPQ